MGEIVSISPADLLIDTSNPRLLEASGGQRQAHRAIAEDQQRKLAKLVTDIVIHGLSPTDLPIVMRNEGDRRRYVVLEGNRRLVALKSLENPESIVGAVDDVVLRKIREASRDYLEDPIQSIDCLVVKDREEARHWIELRHTGENEGAGLVRWGSDDSARFRARSGRVEPYSQALNFLEDQHALTPEARRRVPVTSFKRLLGTPELREKVGVDLTRGELSIVGDAKKVAKALKYIVNDLAEGHTKVADIYTKQQRIDYANNLPASIVVKPAKNAGKASSKKKSKAKKKATKRRRRLYLIPADCVLSVSDERALDIESELRRLRLDDYENAIAVLFRVFIELSVDDYIANNAVGATVNDKLRVKMQKTVGDLVKHKKLTAAQAVPVRRALQRDSFLAPSVNLMNGYIHNQYVFPAPSDLRAHWNGLQPFIMAIWS